MAYDSLLRRVWHGDSDDPKQARAIVNNLGRKLGDKATQTAYSHIVLGVSYRVGPPSAL